jgi:hypothetical protein
MFSRTFCFLAWKVRYRKHNFFLIFPITFQSKFFSTENLITTVASCFSNFNFCLPLLFVRNNILSERWTVIWLNTNYFFF